MPQFNRLELPLGMDTFSQEEGSLGVTRSEIIEVVCLKCKIVSYNRPPPLSAYQLLPSL